MYVRESTKTIKESSFPKEDMLWSFKCKVLSLCRINKIWRQVRDLYSSYLYKKKNVLKRRRRDMKGNNKRE